MIITYKVDFGSFHYIKQFRLLNQAMLIYISNFFLNLLRIRFEDIIRTRIFEKFELDLQEMSHFFFKDLINTQLRFMESKFYIVNFKFT
jgi:hypothetical protein